MSNTVIVNDVLDHSALGPVVMMMYVCVCLLTYLPGRPGGPGGPGGPGSAVTPPEANCPEAETNN